MKQTLRFETNIPQPVALAFDDGISVEGRYGDQVMYTLEDERVMYVPPIVQEQIKRLHIQRGDPFQVVKREKKAGNRRSIEWAVERLETREPAPSTPSKATDEAASRAPEFSSTRESSIALANNGNAPSVGNRSSEAALPFAGTPQGHYILSALVNMVDTTVAVEAYAKAKGRELHFSTEDIRALTITCFIQRTRENGGVR
jgi:hypothetical protein